MERFQVNPIPANRKLLFRAHESKDTTQTGAYESTVVEKVFNDRYRHRYSVEMFIKLLGKHLGRTVMEKPGKAIFTSTSPRLEWTLHLAGQKARALRDTRREGQVSFVVFDLQALSKLDNISVFRVSDMLDLINERGQAGLIESKYQQWASNCDEYVIMGRGIHRGVINVVPWEDIERMPIITGRFYRAYTLEHYSYFRDTDYAQISNTSTDKMSKMVVELAKVLAGGEGSRWDMIQHFVDLILQPGIWFWGIRLSGTEEEARIRCREVIEDGLATELGQVSI